MTKKLKKTTAFLSAAVMVMAMLLYFPSGTFNIDFGLKASAEEITPSQPTDGDGTSTNPYKIGTAAELYWFAGLVNGTLDGVTQNTAAWAKLTANITVNNNVLVDGALNTTNSGSFTSWTPIGNYSSQYTGTFDGQNNTISGLYFDNGNTRYVGLFGCVGSGGNVSNVGIVDSYFNGNRYAGGVCGNNDGTIKNCYNTGAVSGNDYYAGGVCGDNDGTIQNCYNTGAVSGRWKVGGVCGENYNSTIQNCYSTGTVSGWSNIGGVCGYNDGSTITNCYFDSDNYSGDAGHIYSGTITNVAGKTTNAFEKGEVCYLLQLGQENDSESGKAPMVWGQTIGTDKAPVLTSDSKKTVYLIDGTYSNTNSEITEKEHNFGADFRCTNCGNYEAPELNENVYEITNASQLYWFAEYVNNGNTSAEAILKENIVVNENVLGADGKLVSDTSKFVSWTPIGSVSNKYTGTFDGNGKTISGLYLYNGDKSYVGLFGYVGSGGNISNVGVVASYFKGKNNVGGVCGYNYSPIKNCYNTGAVNGSENVGGVCGYNYSTIQNCYSTGGVSGNDQVGGVCGFNEGGTIENCYNTGAVNESEDVGGVCGFNYNGTITNCYNTGAVSGTDCVGGVCGYNPGEITNCYNTGSVTGTGYYVGGVCGENTATITNCYNTGAVSGNTYVGGVCGKNTYGTITNCYFDSKVYTGNAVGDNMGTVSENVLGKETTQFTSGEVCYLLNNRKTDGSLVWYQTINTDTAPVLDSTHSIVYASKPCESEFANTEITTEKKHTMTMSEDGTSHICSGCKKTEQHADVATFSVDEATHSITADCPSCGTLGTITLSASDATYDGTAKAATVEGELTGIETPNILYKEKNGTGEATETVPTNAETYVASITYTDADSNEHSISVEYTIEKAELTVSAGTYKVSKEYDGTTGAGESSGELEISGIINDDDVTVNTGTIGEYSNSDVGNDYEVEVNISLDGTAKDNYTLGDVTSIKVPAEITKATQSAPSAPTVSTFDCHSVTLTPNAAYQFSMDGENWQDSNVFTGLTAGTKYTFYQRIKATANYEASVNSTGVLQTTAEHDYSAENAKPEALYKKATCTSPAVYYYSCSVCDNVEEDSTHTFENGSTLEHNDTDNDNRCDTCGHIMDGIGAKLAGYSLSLSGNIGVNFYMELSDEVVADETAYMQFTLPNGEKPQVKVSEAEKVTLDNKEYYVFTCEVAAKEMDNTITAQIITSDGEGVAYKYTVRDYADYILDEANGYDDNTKAVVSAMLSYGDYAKAYFSGEELTATSEINAVTSDMLAGYAMTESGILPEGIEYYGSTLLLESKTTIRHYFKVTEGTDVSAYNMTEKGGYYYIQCSDIPAGSLGTAQNISVGEYTISYSPLSYAYAALNSDSTSDNLKNLVKALYLYNNAAIAYMN